MVGESPLIHDSIRKFAMKLVSYCNRDKAIFLTKESCILSLADPFTTITVDGDGDYKSFVKVGNQMHPAAGRPHNGGFSIQV